jgi:hypothetical protein
VTETTTDTYRLLQQARANGKPLGGRSARDSQRSKVYRAEAVLSRFTRNLTVEQIEAMTRKIQDSAYVRKHYGAKIPRIRFRFINGHRVHATASSFGVITLPNWARSDRILIHEICHVYLDLVRKFMGAEAHAALKASFKAHGVKYTCPRPRRQMTEEQRQAARERLAAARAKRGNTSTGEWVIVLHDGNRWGVVTGLSGEYRVSASTFVRDALVRKTDEGALKVFKRAQYAAWNRTDVRKISLKSLKESLGDSRFIPRDWTPDECVAADRAA